MLEDRYRDLYVVACVTAAAKAKSMGRRRGGRAGSCRRRAAAIAAGHRQGCDCFGTNTVFNLVVFDGPEDEKVK